MVGSWTHDTSRPGGAHIIIDFDGKIYCCADLITQAAYHAERANGPSVGIEVVQGHSNAELYQDQIAVAAHFALALCKVMPVPIQFQIPKPYTGHPSARFVMSLQKDVPLGDVVGVLGHRNLTANRGEGDPGNAIMDAIEEIGAEVLDFDTYEDLTTWKGRQATLGLSAADGIPGPATVAALRRTGKTSGVWRSPDA